MASRDLAGLLTGISGAQQPDPRMSSDQWRMAFGGQQAQNLGNSASAVSGMLNGKPLANAQESIQIGMGKLDQNNIQDLQTIARQQQMSGDTQGLALTTAKIKALQEKESSTKQRNSLIKMARAQNNPNMVAWLEAEGDIKTAASVMLKQPKLANPEAYTSMFTKEGKPIRTAVIAGVLNRATENGWTTIQDNEELFATDPTKEKGAKTANLNPDAISTYDSIIALNPELEQGLNDIGIIWNSINKDKKRVLLSKAEEIYENSPELGREGALLQAANIERANNGGGSSAADPDANVTVK
jgi:hypothetical protein